MLMLIESKKIACAKCGSVRIGREYKPEQETKLRGEHMTIQQLAKLVSEREANKKQVNIAQINEILGVLSDLIYEDPEALGVLINNGLRRSRNKSVKKK